MAPSPGLADHPEGQTGSRLSGIHPAVYAHARPKIPSDLKSGAWKTGPNLWDRLTRQAPTQAHRSPRCSAKCVYSPSNLQRTRDHETIWCSEFTKLRDLIAKSSGEL